MNTSPQFVAALGGLLHGEGTYGPRFEKFANSIRIWDAEGQGCKVTWPLATLLQALYAPAQHTFVWRSHEEKPAA